MWQGRDLTPLRGAPGLVRLLGHRGARGIMPENTLEGFLYALLAGVDILELDVLVTADRVPVITHNPQLSPDMTRDASGNWLAGEAPSVAALSFDELQRYDTGSLRTGSDYAALFGEQSVLHQVRIPKLADLCALLARPGRGDVWLNVEIKSNPLHPADTLPADDLVAAVLAALASGEMLQRSLLQSFDWQVLEAAGRQAPLLPRSFLSRLPGPEVAGTIYPGSPWMAGRALAKAGGSLPRLVQAADGQIWSPYFADLSEADLAEARALGLIVYVWTVNETPDIERMISLGVDGIITDYPARVQRALQARGQAWSEDISASPIRRFA